MYIINPNTQKKEQPPALLPLEMFKKAQQVSRMQLVIASAYDF